MKVRSALAMLVAGASVAVMGVFATPASAIPVVGDPLDDVFCNAAGNVYVDELPAGKISLTVQGIGRCQDGSDRGPFIGLFKGTGTALTLGGCDSGLPLVRHLDIPVQLTLVSTTQPRFKKVFNMRWRLFISSFPRFGEHLIYEGGRNLPWGAGVIRTTAEACSGDQVDSGALFDFNFVDRLGSIS